MVETCGGGVVCTDSFSQMVYLHDRTNDKENLTFMYFSGKVIGNFLLLLHTEMILGCKMDLAPRHQFLGIIVIILADSFTRLIKENGKLKWKKDLWVNSALRRFLVMFISPYFGG